MINLKVNIIHTVSVFETVVIAENTLYKMGWAYNYIRLYKRPATNHNPLCKIRLLFDTCLCLTIEHISTLFWSFQCYIMSSCHVPD